METDITPKQAREILTTPGYDAYGRRRIYFTHPADSVYAGQTGCVKSLYHLDRAVTEGFDRMYVVDREGEGVPIRRA